MPTGDDTSSELLEESEHNEDLARRALDEPTQPADPLKSLPLAQRRAVHQKPDLLPTGTSSACGVEGRLVETGQDVTAGVQVTFPVDCRLPKGHDGPHIAREQWQYPGTWDVWTWD